jgi:hypothetical protein
MDATHTHLVGTEGMVGYHRERILATVYDRGEKRGDQIR